MFYFEITNIHYSFNRFNPSIDWNIQMMEILLHICHDISIFDIPENVKTK